MSDNPYHAHLDQCQDCRENVMFTRCTEGPRLLKQHVTGIDPGPEPDRRLAPDPFEGLLKTFDAMMRRT